MVIQRRFNGSVDFNRDWNAYVEGFGSVDGEHWIGLSTIKQFEYTGTPKDELRIDLESFDGETGAANYKSFRIFQTQRYSLQVTHQKFIKPFQLYHHETNSLP